MAKILLVNLPLHGHVNPTLALTKELVERGHEVTYLITEDFKELVEPTGANIMFYKATIGKKTFMKDLFSTMSSLYYKILKIGTSYDCLVYEMAFFFGAKLGEQLDIKTICLTSTFALNKKVLEYYGKNHGILAKSLNTKLFRTLMTRMLIKDKHLRENNLLYELTEHNPPLNIVYTSRNFQIEQKAFSSKHFAFVGPSISGRAQDTDIPFHKMKNKIIYISLGTISNSIKFYKTCIKAFRDTHFSIIMSIGKDVALKELGDIPDNFYIYSFVPQIEVLKHADLFITHCGMNSANEAMYLGVPMLAIPQRADQPLVASQVENLGLGIKLSKKNVSPETIKKNACIILSDVFYQLNIKKMQKTMANSGGSNKAAGAIESYIAN